jgi:hypothetical protein
MTGRVRPARTADSSGSAAICARVQLRAPMTARADGFGQLSQAGAGVASQHPPDHHHSHAVHPRSPGMGCTVTPAAVRN